jgi:hypothetical protein
VILWNLRLNYGGKKRLLPYAYAGRDSDRLLSPLEDNEFNRLIVSVMFLQ